MHEELKIEKERTQVSVVTVGGIALSGQVFVHPFHPLRGGRELPEDVLNAPDSYVPLLTEGGVVLVAKTAIAELVYERNAEDESCGSLPIGVSVTLSVTLSGGNSFSGAIWVEGPVNTPRLLDFMNRLANGNERFLAMHEGSRVRLINRTHIETIRTVD